MNVDPRTINPIKESELRTLVYAALREKFKDEVSSICTLLESKFGCQKIFSIDDIERDLEKNHEASLAYISLSLLESQQFSFTQSVLDGTPIVDIAEKDVAEKNIENICIISSTITSLCPNQKILEDLGLYFTKTNTGVAQYYLKNNPVKDNAFIFQTKHFIKSTPNDFTFGEYHLKQGLIYLASSSFKKLHSKVLAQEPDKLVERRFVLS
jgi:hypothetical protein